MAFDNNKLGELRPNQIITTFGPGSVVDAVKDSVTILDISYWKQKGQKIIDGRLASYLGVDCFFMPRTSFSGDVPVVTFPYWHVCSNLKCGRLFDARKNFDLDKYLKYGVTCPECHRPAYPSRFITICEDGHMSDFPWKWWVHRGNLDCNGTLKMYSTGNTSTLADMWVECSCGAKRSMNGATQRENFEDIACPGHHPFRPSVKNQRCNKPVIPSQRGASKDTLAAWLNSPAVKGLSQKYSDSYREFCESKGWTITVVRNAVYVLMHTFAHLMIKQMSMSSGYSSSAIRERIYFGDKMSGILLYTGSSDKEGSLGGLVELGNIDQMTNLMRDAFQEALVCTNDPECMSNLPAGKNSNGAACHSCCMISETACENGNRMLDRGLVVPIPEREECSYFKELVSELCQVEI